MSDTGIDIAEALEDVGMRVRVIFPTVTSPEYQQIRLNRQVTKAFIKEFFREVTIPYNTPIVAGNVVEIMSTGEKFLVTSITPQGFEDEVIKYEAVYYKVNVSGELKRYTGETRNTDYLLTPQFTTVHSNCYALLTEELFEHGIDATEELGRIGLENHQCIMPTAYDPRLEDRYQPVSGEYHIVESIKIRVFPNLSVLALREDTR